MPSINPTAAARLRVPSRALKTAQPAAAGLHKVRGLHLLTLGAGWSYKIFIESESLEGHFPKAGSGVVEGEA